MRPLALLFAVAVVSILAGCAAPGPSPENYGVAPALPRGADADDFPRAADEISGPAVTSLLNQANAERYAGRPDQAGSLLERALRIEPRNPFVWQALAAAHLELDRPDQAEAAAQRSNSLARGNPHLEVENWRIIADARAARGDASGAEQARLRADQLLRLLAD